MNEEMRYLLYPLALAGHFFFALRMSLQWLMSEKAHKSVTPRIFWYLSLAGTFSLMVHGWLQQQYPLFALQLCNGVIAWRNLNLMESHARHVSFKQVQQLLLLSMIASIPLFGVQLLLYPHLEWFRSPNFFWGGHVPLFWHVIGSIGLILSSFRFWVQWWLAEKQQKSELGASFWWISLTGAILSVLYFCRIGDPVNIIGPAAGIVPYVRNLILLKTHG